MGIRLRQAREYIGLSTAEAATFLGKSIDALERAEENGSGLSLRQWELLAKLYRRPVRWLRGEPVPPVYVPEEVAQMMDDRRLSEADRQEVVGFVEFLSTPRSPRP